MYKGGWERKERREEGEQREETLTDDRFVKFPFVAVNALLLTNNTM